ncbi:adenylate/guanylate cyclase domain-containing protein [Deinococcus hohokamensis]|uniref:Adenylate/guanylate cyclase domain-containing protein n=1 Tax=Deinococcus hohokamensis TaxID=309883 RepID=A0ABV9IAE3_9DEIO
MRELLLPLPAPQEQESIEACLVLVDLVGSTQMAHALPLPHYMAVMTEFVQVMILSFEALGGEVLQHQGDAVLALWPATGVAHAALAAVQAHERAGRIGLAEMLGLALQLRAGVALGEVVTGIVGGQPSAYGLPVNYARRLCESSRPGETLACAGVTAHLGAGVQAAAPRHLQLQGFGQNCEAYALSPVPRVPVRTA